MNIAAMVFAATLQLYDNWDDNQVNGWGATNSVAVIASTNYCLDIGFTNQTAAVADEVMFFKTLTNIYPSVLSFKIKCPDYQPASFAVCIWCSNTWFRKDLPLVLSTNYANYDLNTIFINWFNGVSTNIYPQFMLDLRNTKAVGLYFKRNPALSEQHYLVDDFSVTGDKDLPPSDVLNDLRYDMDGDGNSDYAEKFVLNSNPYDKDSNFQIAGFKLFAGRYPELSWSARVDRTYNVYRSTDMTNGFIMIRTNAIGSGWIYLADYAATNSPLYYYKITMNY